MWDSRVGLLFSSFRISVYCLVSCAFQRFDINFRCCSVFMTQNVLNYSNRDIIVSHHWRTGMSNMMKIEMLDSGFLAASFHHSISVCIRSINKQTFFPAPIMVPKYPWHTTIPRLIPFQQDFIKLVGHFNVTRRETAAPFFAGIFLFSYIFYSLQNKWHRLFLQLTETASGPAWDEARGRIEEFWCFSCLHNRTKGSLVK